MDMILAHITTPPPDPSKSATAMPQALSRMVIRMMAKRADDRPTLVELRALFAELRQAPSKPVPKGGRTATILIGAALFLAGVIALGAVWFVQNSKSDEPAPQPAPVEPVAVAPPPVVPVVRHRSSTRSHRRPPSRPVWVDMQTARRLGRRRRLVRPQARRRGRWHRPVRLPGRRHLPIDLKTKAPPKKPTRRAKATDSTVGTWSVDPKTPGVIIDHARERFGDRDQRHVGRELE